MRGEVVAACAYWIPNIAMVVQSISVGQQSIKLGLGAWVFLQKSQKGESSLYTAGLLTPVAFLLKIS